MYTQETLREMSKSAKTMALSSDLNSLQLKQRKKDVGKASYGEVDKGKVCTD